LVELAPSQKWSWYSRRWRRPWKCSSIRQSRSPIRLLTSLDPSIYMIVLDNCEHLLEATARLVDSLLDSCPRLRILATSREALGVAGEVRWSVPTLSAPERQGTPSPEEREGYESVRLFIDRARNRDPLLLLELAQCPCSSRHLREARGDSACHRAGLCQGGHAVFGAYLGEAPRRTRALDARGRTAKPRRRTLEGTLDWSYDLLSEPERNVYRRLSVFAGGVDSGGFGGRGLRRRRRGER
jgi:predicted ATPase